MLADHDLDVDAEIVRTAEDLDDAAYGGLAPFRILEKFHVDDQAFHLGHFRDGDGLDADAVGGLAGGGNFHALGDLDPLLNALVVRGDEVPRAPDMEFADHGGMGPRQHLENFSIGAAIGLDAGDPHQGAVAVHGAARGTGGDVDIALDAFDGTIRNQEAVAVAMHVEAAGG